MTLIMEASALAGALKNAASVVAARNTIPILANVRLYASGGELLVTASDLDVEYQQRIALDDAAELSLTVDAKRLSGIASAAAPGAQISLDHADGRLTVKSGRSRWVLPTLPSDDFPSLPFGQMIDPVAIDAEELAALIKRVLWSRGTEETRYYLNGPFLHEEGGCVHLVTTNGHTAARMGLDVEWPDDAENVILGPKFCALAERLCSEGDGDVTLAWGARFVRLIIGSVTLTAKNIDGIFPDYRRVIPAQVESPMVFEPQEMRAALRRVTMVRDSGTECVRLARGEDSLTLSMESKDGSGSGCEELPVSGPSTEDTGINWNYLSAMAEACGGDSIAMHQSDPGHIARFERVVSDGFVGVIMPMRI